MSEVRSHPALIEFADIFMLERRLGSLFETRRLDLPKLTMARFVMLAAKDYGSWSYLLAR